MCSSDLTAPIRVIHLNHAAIWNTIEVVVVAVDETNILRQRFRLPDSPSADARLRDVFEDLYAFLLDDLAVIVRKFKQIPVPGGRDDVLSIWRQILFRDLPTFQRLASYLVIGGKADPCTVFPEMQIAFIPRSRVRADSFVVEMARLTVLCSISSCIVTTSCAENRLNGHVPPGAYSQPFLHHSELIHPEPE